MSREIRLPGAIRGRDHKAVTLASHVYNPAAEKTLADVLLSVAAASTAWCRVARTLAFAAIRSEHR